MSFHFLDITALGSEIYHLTQDLIMMTVIFVKIRRDVSKLGVRTRLINRPRTISREANDEIHKRLLQLVLCCGLNYN